MCSRLFTSVVLWHGTDFLSSILLLFSACSMARGQEETSTSQAGYRRRPGRDTPSASSIISSLSMEELSSYCQIPDNIDIELPDSPAESTTARKMVQYILPGNSSQSSFASLFSL